MFFSFHGATVNVTALPFPPYWDTAEERSPDGTTTKGFTGTDYLMLEAIAGALNFSIRVLPTANWDEVRVHFFRLFVNMYSKFGSLLGPEILPVLQFHRHWNFVLVM